MVGSENQNKTRGIKMSNPSSKICSKCKEEVSLDAFYKNKKSVDGLQHYCISCKKVVGERYFQENKEDFKVRRRESYFKNRESNFKGVAKRRAKKLKATPSWDLELTDFVVKEAYVLASVRREETGLDWHVDHVVPLQGALVSGLHVWNNIQLLPAQINKSKGNRYDTA